MNIIMFRQRIKEALNEKDSEYFMFAHSVIGSMAAASIILALSEVFPYFRHYDSILLSIEWVTTVFFTIEYILRFWVTEKRWLYVRSPMGLVDLVSFVPSYLGLGSFGFLKAARFIRLARLSRIANLSRIRKVLRKD